MSSSKKLVIFGGKGGGEIVAQYIDRPSNNHHVLGFLNDTFEKGHTIGGYPVLGRFSDWNQLPEDTLFIAPLHKAKCMPSRAAVIDGLGVPGSRWGRAVHPRAELAISSTIGPGTTIGAFCDLHPAVTVGRHVAIRSGAFIAHDAVVEDFAFIGALSAILGYAEIGEGAHIGPKSVVKERLRIGRYSVIGIGSTVIREVEDYAIVAGCPARHIGWVTH